MFDLNLMASLGSLYSLALASLEFSSQYQALNEERKGLEARLAKINLQIEDRVVAATEKYTRLHGGRIFGGGAADYLTIAPKAREERRTVKARLVEIEWEQLVIERERDKIWYGRQVERLLYDEYVRMNIPLPKRWAEKLTVESEK